MKWVLVAHKYNYKHTNFHSAISSSILSKDGVFLYSIVRLSKDGAKAILDQLPINTPNAKAIANQYRVEPPKKINANSGRRVVPLV